MKSKLHIIRHGMTEGNKKKWYYGELDLPILKEGSDQLEAMKKQNVYPKINGKFFTSGMKRTNETLQVIYGDVDFIELNEIMEMKFGIFEGKTYEEIKENEHFIRWMEDMKGSVKLPDGDSRISFRDRVFAGFEKMINIHRLEELKMRHKEDEVESLCVCHGGVIGCIMAELFPEEKNFFEWIPDQGRGFTIILNDGEFERYEEL